MQTAYASLGLAILSALSMGPALAGSQDFVQHIPLLVKVMGVKLMKEQPQPWHGLLACGGAACCHTCLQTTQRRRRTRCIFAYLASGDSLHVIPSR